MRIHLIFAPTTFALNHGDLGKGIDPPLGILYLASFVREYVDPNIQIKITDGLIEGYDNTLKEALTERADIIGISVVTPNALGAYKLANDIKAVLPQSKVILGGPHPTALPDEALLKSQADVVVIGEGEITFAELIRSYPIWRSNPEKLKNIDGLCIKLNNTIEKTSNRIPVADLDSIPFPARDLVDMNKYSGYPITKSGKSTTILSSRGCPFNCTYCSNNVWRVSGPAYRSRSPKNIADEIEYLTKKYGFREFFDNSDEFNTNIVKSKELLREIIRRNLNINLKCQIRAKPMDDELAMLMKEAGVWYLHLGIESGNEKTLVGVQKKITLKDVETCCNLLKKYDIKIWGLFMYFNIWEEDGKLVHEDYAESMNTFRYAKKLYKNKLIDYFGGSITTPYPGSKLWDTAMKYNLIKEECIGNWDMWFYKRELRLISKFPNTPEQLIFKLHQKTVRYTIRALLLDKLINIRNLKFTFTRGFYYLKRESLLILKSIRNRT